ncbi:hypothetical protein [Flavilitoribacter nigricans]|uniref:Uncharacterized protein n=1 Tax=Flavilitoribacter nigricans (strain ATCC 23147 / DSM 23189 / NBRC 102662 / NCIMB 1420 / SS-2) TaxID=1122177 RepID=A0A2D0MYM9_FLAN2|nr:hypothetical protein [Flavilitoribacter nigricans]PHN01374.1 hypothetical protein CRP01_37550 [Flavilitoribacter nigricans DSM 23189 = NBRC 102662]
MGFGFALFIVFIILPFTGILLLAWLLSGKLLFGKMLRQIWLGIFGLVFFLGIVRWLTAKTELDKEDYYGKYVINRTYFPGKQSAWQYDHFRFEITEQDSIFFYLTDQDKILKTYRGTIRTTDPGNHPSDRLIIEMEQPTHHILTSNPTTYRSNWSFYLVFWSPKFHNVFFKKGRW